MVSVSCSGLAVSWSFRDSRTLHRHTFSRQLDSQSTSRSLHLRTLDSRPLRGRTDLGKLDSEPCGGQKCKKLTSKTLRRRENLERTHLQTSSRSRRYAKNPTQSHFDVAKTGEHLTPSHTCDFEIRETPERSTRGIRRVGRPREKSTRGHFRIETKFSRLGLCAQAL